MFERMTKAMTGWTTLLVEQMRADGWSEIDVPEGMLSKGHSAKYLKRVATGNPRHPWRYFYRPTESRPKAQFGPIKFVPTSEHTKDETWVKHFDLHPDHGGIPSDERHSDVHAKIIDAAMDGKPEKKNPVATFIIGGSGSGKSTTLNAGRKYPDAVRVDPDGVREQLPEYQAAIADDNAVAQDASAKTHEESSWLAKKIRDLAIAHHHDLLIDGTGRNHGKMAALMNRMKRNGYRIHLIGVHVDPDEGLRRVKSRMAQIRRDVPDKDALESYAAFPHSFNVLKRVADSYEGWSTSRTSKSGRAQKFVQKNIGGKERHATPHLKRLHDEILGGKSQ